MFTHSPPDALYRIVAFTMPDASRAAFLGRAARAQAVLQQQPGLLGQQVFEKVSGPGRFGLVSIAAWADQTALDAATKAIAAMEAATGFDRPAFLASAGIAAETGTFRSKAI